MEVFREAVKPSRRACLGLELKPLTLGHIRVLLREENAFALGEPPSLDDLLLAVFVCSQNADQAERILTGWRSIFLPLFFNLWGRLFRWRRMDLRAALAEFQAHYDAGTAMPEFLYDRSKLGKPFESHFYFRLLARALHTFGLSWDQAHTMRMTEIAALWGAFAEVEGKAELAGEQWESLFAMRDAAEAAEQAAKGGNPS